jgi:opacity protein-like surface antigen
MNKLIPLLSILTAFAAIAFTPASAHADSTSATNLGLGVHGGINLSDLDIKSSGSATINAVKDNKQGPVLGAHLELGNEIVMIRPEANYSVRGYTFANTIEVDQKYLEIPVLVRVNVLPGLIQPFVEVGPQLGIHLSNDVKALGISTSFDTNSRTVDFSGLAGAGLRLNVIPNLAIDAEARYNYGFTDQNSRDDIEIHTRGFQLLAGLTFRI